MVSTVKQLSKREQIRMRCEAREDNERSLLTQTNAAYRRGKEEGVQEAVDAVDKLLADGSITEEAAELIKSELRDKP